MTMNVIRLIECLTQLLLLTCLKYLYAAAWFLDGRTSMLACIQTWHEVSHVSSYYFKVCI